MRFAVGAAVLLVALAGCTPSGPTVVATPHVVYEEPATSPLEGDPWVIALRASDLGYVLAANNADFTLEQFAGTRSADLAADDFRAWEATYVANAASPVAYPGPSILLPLSVTESDDGASAEIVACDASGTWLITENSEPEFDLSKGAEVTFTMREVPGTTVIEVAGRRSSSRACDATGAPVGRFDPEPERSETIDAASVRPPAGFTD